MPECLHILNDIGNRADAFEYVAHLYRRDKANLFSIVLIHGLGGHYRQTWTHPETGKCWVEQYLGCDLPAARIMRFEYDSGILKETIVHSILTLAASLREKLWTKRIGYEVRNFAMLGLSCLTWR